MVRRARRSDGRGLAPTRECNFGACISSPELNGYFAMGQQSAAQIRGHRARYRLTMGSRLSEVAVHTSRTMPSLSMHTKNGVVRRRDDGVLDMMVPHMQRGNGGH